jgi:hypothetical protein
MSIYPQHIIDQIYHSKFDVFDKNFYDYLTEHPNEIDSIIDFILIVINDDNFYNEKPKYTANDIISRFLHDSINSNNIKFCEVLVRRYNNIKIA